MSEDLDKIDKRKEYIKKKIKDYFQDKTNLILIGILAFALFIRLYYFFITSGQPLWWDETAYGSIAKDLVIHKFRSSVALSGEKFIRPFLLPFLWSILLRINFSEELIKFILIILPSFFSVFLIFLIGKELYNKKVGLVSAFIFSTIWIHLFYSMRLLTGVPSLFFILISLYYFILSEKTNFKVKYFSISLFAISIAIFLRYPNGLILFAYLFAIFIFKGFSILKQKSFWIGGFLGISPLLIFFLSNIIRYKSILPNSSYVEAVSSKFAFNILNFISVYLKTVFFIFFLIGLIIILIELILGFDLIKKKQRLKGNALLLIIFLVIFSFFIFYIKGAEDRWLLFSIIPLVFFSAIGIISVSEYLGKYKKEFIIIFIILVLFLGAYSQIKFSNSLIIQKKDSYSQMKNAFLWLKENSNEKDTVISSYAELYSIYYAERNTYSLPQNKTEFENMIKEKNPTFLIIHGFNQLPKYIYSYPVENNNSLKLINAWFFDSERQKPAVVIYKFVQ